MGIVKKIKNSQPPISAHPAFPAIVALWFAALLGLGSLIVPVVLFEKLASATGLASVFDAANPPLGTTARLLIAFVAAIGGAGLGLFLARKVISAQSDIHNGNTKRSRPVEPSKQKQVATKRPISAREDLGYDSLDEPVMPDRPADKGPIKRRRRMLSATDEVRPSAPYEYAPLPGGNEQAGDSEEVALPMNDHNDDHNDNFVPPSGDVPDTPLTPNMALDEGAVRNFSEPDRSEHPELDDSTDASGQINVVQAEEVRAPDFIEPAAVSESLMETTPTPDFINGLCEEEAEMREDLTPTSEADNPIGTHAVHSHAVPSSFTNVRPEDEIEKEEIESPEAYFASDPVAPATPTAAYHNVQAASAPGGSPSATLPAEPASQQTSVSGNESQRNDSQPLADLGMAELLERFTHALQSTEQVASTPGETALASMSTTYAAIGQQSDEELAELAESPLTSADQAPSASTLNGQSAIANRPSVAPLVFRRNAGSEIEPSEEVAPKTDAESGPEDVTPLPSPLADDTSLQIPKAFQSLGYDEEDDDDSEEDLDSLILDLSAHLAPEKVAPNASVQTNNPLHDESPAPALEQDEVYSSLLDMKSPLTSDQQFPRIEEEVEGNAEQIEPVVVFPGQEYRRAMPAADGPVRDPMPHPAQNMVGQNMMRRPFDAPEQPVATSESANDPGETERALREALEKLQKVSGEG